MSKRGKKKTDELAALADLPDADINTSDIAEIADWSAAVRGHFYRPLKQSITIRLDADVIHWLKQGGKGYQTRVNKILRRAMEQQEKSSS